ncbi:Hypothetical protein SMAX5B_002794 [Scophthalmus maximus]|uniref:Uncharacterized protein n=1 Tax=Scophthalmus maximus TaxID=52904 RepID=A0A2U9BF81_SCOMX|nr:Hypothetical protein SMAX5B_002794 [Scophthalmus maximus]
MRTKVHLIQVEFDPGPRPPLWSDQVLVHWSEEPFTPAILVRTELRSPKVRTKQGVSGIVSVNHFANTIPVDQSRIPDSDSDSDSDRHSVVVSRCLSADDADDVPQVCAVARRHAARRPRSRTVPTEREVE